MERRIDWKWSQVRTLKYAELTLVTQNECLRDHASTARLVFRDASIVFP